MVTTINFDPKNIEDLETISKMISCLQNESTLREDSLQNMNNPSAIKNNQELEELKKQREQENNEKEKALREKDEKIFELEEELKENKKTLEEYKEKLERCSISCGSDNPNETIYFKVSKSSLEKSTISSKSLYCAKREGDIYKFEINIDGPILKAISNPECDLRPYCEIIYQDKEPNTIKTDTIGQFQMVGSDITVVDKARIKLIKQ